MKISTLNILGVGLLMLQTATYAQRAPVNKTDRIKVSGVLLKEVTGTLQMDMRLQVGALDLDKMERMTVTPRLVGADGNSLEFKSFVVDGKTRRRVEARNAVLDKKITPPKYLDEYIYSERVQFAPWMEKAKLEIKGDLSCCGGESGGSFSKTLPDTVWLEPKLPAHRYVMKPRVNFITPNAEAVKARQESGKAFLAFNSGSSQIIPTLKSNTAELGKITAAIDKAVGDENIIINGVNIDGYASLDGSSASNMKLSDGRAASLLTYLKGIYKINDKLFSSQGKGEDWASVEPFLSAMDFNTKERVFKVLGSDAAPDTKITQIKQLMGPVTFRIVETTLYPTQRRVEYRLDYAVKDFSLEEAKQVIKTRPAQLSLNEMFIVANSYEQGSAEFNEVFDIAVRMFPDNEIANINAVAAAVVRGDTISAERYIKNVKDLPAAQNNLAALYMLKGNIDAAKRTLENAESSEQVKHNSSEIKLKESDNALFEKYGKR